jgi:hypothetical protein
MRQAYEIEMHKFQRQGWTNIRQLYRRALRDVAYVEDSRWGVQPFCYYLLTLRLGLYDDYRGDL